MKIKLFVRSGASVEKLRKEAIEFFTVESRIPLGGALKPAPVGFVVYIAYKEELK